MNVPLGLSYNGSGVKINEHPGWVGLNWNLRAGSFITRKVNDLPDDYSVSGKTEYGYYWKRTILDNRSGNINFGDNEKYDTEPDEFYFNINGISGKFFLRENGAWVVQVNKTFKVEYDGTRVFTPMMGGKDLPSTKNVFIRSFDFKEGLHNHGRPNLKWGRPRG